MMLVDTHSHLNDPAYDDIEEIVERAEAAGVGAVVVCGYDLPNSVKAVELARRFKNLYATVGIHPSDADTWNDKAAEELVKLSREPKVIAIGEIGLDYHYDNYNKAEQKAAFEAQIRLAGALDMPIVIHSREANPDTFAILKSNANYVKSCVYHCFSGSPDFAKDVINAGYFMGVDGPVTFKSSPKLKRIVTETPIDRLVLETDCPYLTPVPHRGHRNEPAYVRHIAEVVADLKGVSVEELEDITTRNAERLYRVHF
ncbi:MAG: TatD family hydrolase [Abditibacteriota bacterium]|nr:TatD family hydrolase [Abditibacteriota bacterium]